ncbi:MAG: tetratricopeptide repeat protein [Gammaproteobacteria bacterium]|nr:tetratricopeptide repeat protein [Gammaproteobacteria bacterium]
MVELFWLLLPVAACSGWIAGTKNNLNFFKQNKTQKDFTFNQKYIKGLNLILNEQTDKAVDVFIDLFSVDNDTVETHLALGSLFRRRGEVERAIRIHQNVIARPNLGSLQRLNGLLELGCDYLCAGVLDRAENIFNDILKQDPQNLSALQYLLDIYQQQRDWHAAITIALLLQKQRVAKYTKNIAHYYCELTIISKERGELTDALSYNRQALKYQDNNLRANLIFAELCLINNQIKKGLRTYFDIANLHIAYLDVILPVLITSYHKFNLLSDADATNYNLIIFIEKLIARVPQILSLKEVIVLLIEQKGYNYTLDLVFNSAANMPKLRTIANLLELVGENGFVDNKTYSRIKNCIQQIISEQKLYTCNNCGFNCRELLWLCPSCKSWDTIANIEFID